MTHGVARYFLVYQEQIYTLTRARSGVNIHIEPDPGRDSLQHCHDAGLVVIPTDRYLVTELDHRFTRSHSSKLAAHLNHHAGRLLFSPPY